ncbi:hypothetical protein K1T71_013946 [Dendrolimus kikuchii]|uniref:Uncharacterized protein n=1 Tax=Dendrolimus kikuchii TaxID=765133 RepID=A0ACC1CGD4_9NEOP|nr:hypothetical protein K1T71_013946 [Dendrolimus kikuchii]
MNGNINIEVIVNENTEDVSFKFSGHEEYDATKNDLKLFNVNDEKLKKGVGVIFGREPDIVRCIKPAMWYREEMYDKYNWRPSTKMITIKSVQLKSLTKRPIIVSKQKFENNSKATVTVNTGLSHTVQNTLRTSWSSDHEVSFEQAFEYNINLFVAKLQGTTKVGYKTNWGSRDEKSESVTIGTTNGAEIELKPGQAVTAILSANTIDLEAEVTYVMSLRHGLVAMYHKKYKNHSIWYLHIAKVLERGGFDNEITVKATMKFGYNIEGSLKQGLTSKRILTVF